MKDRRSFLHTGAVPAALALGGLALTQEAQAQDKGKAPFVPARHDKDDWYDTIPGRHRVIFDTTSGHAFGEALLFANNYFTANRSDYGLQNSDLAVIIVARHSSTPFAYNEAMWTKYGQKLDRSEFKDPKTNERIKTNIFNATGYGTQLSNYGTTVDAAIKLGIHFAVCGMATRAIAGILAGPGGNTQAVYEELAANLVANAHIVPAGIVAVSRGQEHGYTLVTAA